MIQIISQSQVPEASNSSLIDKGGLRIQITDTNNQPISNATVLLSYTGAPESTLEELKTDQDGMTELISLPTPPLEYSLEKSNSIQPYSEYSIICNANGYSSFDLSGIQILPETDSTQNIRLKPTFQNSSSNSIISPHTLYGNFPPKIAEDEIKPTNDSGEIVLEKVVIPEYIIVHNGTPADSSAQNYYIPYTDYIKNVASSEIYATWPEAALYANILAIMSFTLNRVFTEWYRGKGYSFTITSSTAFDQKWTKDRNIFDRISTVVDDIFTNYLSRPNVLQPILTQYCDGKSVTCPNWMSQWGSKELADEGYTASEILRYYYGDSIYINSASQVEGIPASFPGFDLDIGSSGNEVLQMQNQLNRIAKVYTNIPTIPADGIYGEKTKEAILAFQKIFGLPVTGIVNRRTWYKISQIYVGITKIAEDPYSGY